MHHIFILLLYYSQCPCTLKSALEQHVHYVIDSAIVLTDITLQLGVLDEYLTSTCKLENCTDSCGYIIGLMTFVGYIETILGAYGDCLH